MSDLCWLTDKQMAHLRPFFPKSHDNPRAMIAQVLSGMVFVNRDGLHWCDAPNAYCPPKPVLSLLEDALQPLEALGEMGIHPHDEGLAAANAEPKTVMIDATYLKAHHTASSYRLKGTSAA
jgi:transposase